MNPRPSPLSSRLRHFFRRLLRGRDKGTVAITFLLSLPILLTLIGILVQYALLATARLTLDRALAAAARSAMTTLPTDPVIDGTNGPAFVQRAARITLEPLSPASPTTTSEAATVAEALQRLGYALPQNYAARYSYAENATTITIIPIDANGVPVNADYPRTAAPRIRLTISYDFQLTVPIANTVIGRAATIAGVDGRFFTLSSTQDVQLSPGRQTPTNADGEPQRQGGGP